MGEGFSNPVAAGGGALIRNSVHSPDYTATVDGWSINQDGSAEFNNIAIRGSGVVTDLHVQGDLFVDQHATVIGDFQATGATELEDVQVNGAITGGTAWTAPTFTNSWGNFGSPWQVAQYRKDVTGRVWIRGVISGGAAGNSAFTLPVGFRPAGQYVTAAISSGSNPPGLCRLQLNTNGTVVPQNAVVSFVAIDTSFDTV